MSDPETRPNLHTITADQISGIQSRTSRKLIDFESQLGGLTFLEWFKQSAEQNHLSLGGLAAQVGVGRQLLSFVARRYGITYLNSSEASRAKMQDPEFRARHIERTRAMLLEKWQNPEWRQMKTEEFRAMRQNPEFKQKINAGIEAKMQDPAYRQRVSDAARTTFAQSAQHPEWRQRDIAATKAKWQDPEYRARMAEVTSTSLKRLWQDPEFRQRRVATASAQQRDPIHRKKLTQGIKAKWQDPEYRAKKAQELLNLWGDPEFRSKKAQELANLKQDPGYRKRHAERNRAMLARLRLDPAWRAKNLAAVRASWAERWSDPEFRARMAEVGRQTRLNPDYLNRWVVPTIHGERWDIGHAQSAWEANLARVLRFVGRQVSYRQSFRLAGNDIFELDFLTVDNRGRLVGYEIMAHPVEYLDGWDKLEQVIEQYPEIVFRIVDEHFYRRLESRFAQRINGDPQFAGWEHTGDNLRTSPDKFAPTSTNSPTPSVV